MTIGKALMEHFTRVSPAGIDWEMIRSTKRTARRRNREFRELTRIRD